MNRVPGQGFGIHWRGQPQKETPVMDGVPMVTQCPIASSTVFQYKFRASRPGTHMWHAHTGTPTHFTANFRKPAGKDAVPSEAQSLLVSGYFPLRLFVSIFTQMSLLCTYRTHFLAMVTTKICPAVVATIPQIVSLRKKGNKTWLLPLKERFTRVPCYLS